jgi:type I restriction enzyme S subunit
VGLEDIESHTARFVGSDQPTSVKSSTFRFSPGHVLYGRLRPYLNKVLAPDFEGHCSTEIFPLKPRSGVEREFLLYWLLRDETVARANETARGARMPRANVDAILAFEILLPPAAEQQRIVGLLDEAFEGIAQAKANAERNLENARAVFESAREDALAPRDGWRTGPLGDLCSIKHGFAFKGEFFTDAGEFVLLTPGSFFERGGYRERGEKTKYYIGEIPPEFLLNEGDMLTAMTEQAAGLLGSPLIVPESGKFLHNQRLGLFVPTPGKPWATKFFFHTMNLARVRKEIHDGGTGAKVRHTSPGRIQAVQVSYPVTAKEQQVVADRLDEIAAESERLERIYEQKLVALNELKKSLLHHAFAGAL